MERHKFKKLIDNMQTVSDRSEEVSKSGINTIGYDEPFYELINDLLEEVFEKEDIESIDWFAYEKDFGRDDNIKAYNEEGKEILKTVDGLYNHIFDANP